MPTFNSPGPVAAHLDLSGATVRLRADDRTDTVVDVRPHNIGSSADVELSDSITVDYVDGRLSLRSPKTAKTRLRAMLGAGARVDVEIDVPTGSSVEIRGWGDVTADGTLGAVEIDSAMGDIRLEAVDRVRAKTSMGEIRVGYAGGSADLNSSAGSIRVDRAGADVTAKTSAGDVVIGEGHGELRLSTSMGDVRVERAHGSVRAKTSAGDVRVHEVRSGAVSLDTTYGALEIGVAAGTAAWLDVDAKHGAVRSELDQASAPGDGERTVEIHAVTHYGDITLRRV